MSQEKFQRHPLDSPNHMGYQANRRRLEQAETEQRLYVHKNGNQITFVDDQIEPEFFWFTALTYHKGM